MSKPCQTIIMYRKIPIRMKTIEQSEDDARAVAIMRALGNPVRFQIVRLLAERRECVVSDLTEEFPLAQSSISEHLKVLKDAGVVHGVIDGPNRCYCLDAGTLAFLRGTIASIETQICC
jgi:ArsR family transcriptional regulator